MWKIAIIDDDPNLLEGMREAISWSALGAEWVGEAIDGEEGMALIRREQPDIVITDINMPIMNGLEMIEAVRREGCRSRFIILSGYADFEYARQALRLDVDDYLSKPVTIQSLQAVLGRVMGKLEEERAKTLQTESQDRRIKIFEPFLVKEWLKSVLLGGAARQAVDLEVVRSKLDQWRTQIHRVLCIELQAGESLRKWFDFDRGVMRFAIQNMTEEIAGEFGFSCDHTELNSRHIAFVLHASGTAEGEQRLRDAETEFSPRIAAAIRNHLKLEVRIGLGTVEREWERLCDSFETAYHALNGEGGAAGEEQELNSVRSIRFYHQLAEAIRNVQEEHAKALIAGYTGEWEEKTLTTATVDKLAGELWAIIAYSLYDVGIDLKQICPSFEPVPDALGRHTPQSLRGWLEDTVSLISSSAYMSENVRHRKIVEQVIEFVHDHYMEDITLGLLAERVQISKNYLGQIFKQVMQESFTQYVTRIRIEKAKAMLLEGNLYIYEIAEKVGYNSISYFSTQFKKYTGCNPTELIT